jgi:7,8-dihydropterin-6-yl-methyl-4-(beta-D-ribofuranosyl)aminobenzene 5'-phosphate synthase
MFNSVEVDSLEILVIVDNVTDSLSTNPTGVEAEWRGLLTRGRIRVLSGPNICCAHHGLSLLLTARLGESIQTLLFDAGAERQTFMRNAGILGVDFGIITDIALSHGHWDHAGGMLAAIEQVVKVRGVGKVNAYMHPGMFSQRGLRLPSGLVFPMENVPTEDELRSAGANVICTDQPQVIGQRAFYISGEIPRVTSYEMGLAGQVRRVTEGAEWEPDPLVMDERYVSVNVKGRGQFIFSACSHAGIINVVRHARDTFAQTPPFAIMGGLHLSGATEAIIPETVADLQQFGLQLLAPGHCTGWRAISAMEHVFKERVVPLAVGKRFVV